MAVVFVGHLPPNEPERTGERVSLDPLNNCFLQNSLKAAIFQPATPKQFGTFEGGCWFHSLSLGIRVNGDEYRDEIQILVCLIVDIPGGTVSEVSSCFWDETMLRTASLASTRRKAT